MTVRPLLIYLSQQNHPTRQPVEKPQWHEVIIPDADHALKNNAASILDLAGGQLLTPIQGKNDVEKFTHFTRMGKGDIIYDQNSIYLLRGGTLLSLEGKPYTPKDIKGDATFYNLDGLSKEILVRTSDEKLYHLKFKERVFTRRLKIQYALMYDNPSPPGEDRERVNSTAGLLEFRIVPNTAGSDRQPTLPKDFDSTNTLPHRPVEFAPAALKELMEHGPGWRRAKGEELQWFELAGEANIPAAVLGEYQGKKYILLETRRPYVMLRGEGDSQWGLTKVWAGTDNQGNPAVKFEFGERGAELFSALTKANIGNSLAILVNGKVYSAPVLKNALSNEGTITGKFTQQEVDQLVSLLQAGMNALPATATK